MLATPIGFSEIGQKNVKDYPATNFDRTEQTPGDAGWMSPGHNVERLSMRAAVRFCANGSEHRGRVARPLHRDGRCRRIAYRPDLCRDCAGPAPDRAHTAAPFAGCQRAVVLRECDVHRARGPDAETLHYG